MLHGYHDANIFMFDWHINSIVGWEIGGVVIAIAKSP